MGAPQRQKEAKDLSPSAYPMFNMMEAERVSVTIINLTL
jgi:hypothetical protein